MNKNAQLQGNLQAFPVPASEDHGRVEGITKREYFAAMAMQGLCVAITEYVMRDPKTYTKEAILIADALLNELHPQGTATDVD
jgi:hypothetical protein